MVNINDIETKKFSKAIRGYDMEEVDTFLNDIILTMNELDRNFSVLEKKLDDANKKIKELKDQSKLLDEKTSYLIKDFEDKFLSKSAEDDSLPPEELERLYEGVEPRKGDIKASMNDTITVSDNTINVSRKVIDDTIKVSNDTIKIINRDHD